MTQEEPPITLLPIEIINVIMMQHLGLQDIGVLYKSHRIFHQLTSVQKDIMNDVHRGIIHILKNDKLESLEWIYKSEKSLDLAQIPNPSFSKNMPEYAKDYTPEYIDALQLSGSLEMSQWIYDMNQKTDVEYSVIFFEELFIWACRNNHLSLIKWKYNKSKEHGAKFCDGMMTKAFANSCENKDINVTKWVYSLIQESDQPNGLTETDDSLNNVVINIHFEHDSPFEICCIHNNLETAKWLYKLAEEKGSPIDLGSERGELGRWTTLGYDISENSCKNENYEMAIYVYTLINNSDWIYLLDKLCQKIYEKDDLEKMMWIYNEFHKNNLNVKYKDIFIVACQYGSLNIYKWSYNELTKSDIDKSLIIKVFEKSAIYGYTDICRWLFDMHHNIIEIDDNYQDIFINACISGTSNVETCGLLYEISVIKGKPINMNINVDGKDTLFMVTMGNPHNVRKGSNKYLKQIHSQSEISKWLYNVAMESGEPLEECVSDDGIIKVLRHAVKNNSYLHIPWIYEIGEQIGIKLTDDIIKELLESAVNNKYHFDIYTIQAIYHLRPSAAHIKDYIKDYIKTILMRLQIQMTVHKYVSLHYDSSKECKAKIQKYAARREEFRKDIEGILNWLSYICPEHKNEIYETIKLRKTVKVESNHSFTMFKIV